MMRTGCPKDIQSVTSSAVVCMLTQCLGARTGKTSRGGSRNTQHGDRDGDRRNSRFANPTFIGDTDNCISNLSILIETLSEVIISIPVAIYIWFNKPQTRHTKKHCKTSNGSEEISHNLRANKKSCYNKRNCKPGMYGC